MEVSYTKGALRQLEHVDKLIAQRIHEKIERAASLGIDLRHRSLKGEFSEMFKLRVGDWRVLYTIDYFGDRLIVRQIGHRKDVYR